MRYVAPLLKTAHSDLTKAKQRESNKTIEVVESQLKAVAERTKDWSNIVIAYEPVWLALLIWQSLHFEKFC